MIIDVDIRHIINGNVIVGDTVAGDTTNTVICFSDKTVSVVGVDNLVIVETSGTIMACPKSKVRNVNKSWMH